MVLMVRVHYVCSHPGEFQHTFCIRLAGTWELMDTSGFVEVPRMDCCVVCTNVVLTLVVPKVFLPWVVYDVKLVLCTSICNSKNLISIEQDLCHLTVLFTIPMAVELSQCIGVGCCTWPISLSVSWNIVAFLQLRNRALSSALAVEATMKCKKLHIRWKMPHWTWSVRMGRGAIPWKIVCMYSCVFCFW